MKKYSIIVLMLIGLMGYWLMNPTSSNNQTTIVVNFPAHPHYDAAKKLIPEFEKETGIKVEIDTLQYLRMHDKQVLEIGKLF